MPRTLEKGGITASGGRIVPSSTTQQSCILVRGDRTQFEPIRTHDPTETDMTTVPRPMLVCDPMERGRAFSFSPGGGAVAADDDADDDADPFHYLFP